LGFGSTVQTGRNKLNLFVENEQYSLGLGGSYDSCPIAIIGRMLMFALCPVLGHSGFLPLPALIMAQKHTKGYGMIIPHNLIRCLAFIVICRLMIFQQIACLVLSISQDVRQQCAMNAYVVGTHPCGHALGLCATTQL